MFYAGRIGRLGQALSFQGAPAFSSDFSSEPAGMTTSRASSANYWNSSGVRTAAANNQPRFDYDPLSLQLRGLLVEEARTNYLLNSLAPVTQVVNLAVGTYTLWIEGTGSATSSATTAVGTGFGSATNIEGLGTYGTPNVFIVTTAGTVTITVSGTVTAFQLENGAFPTSMITTTVAAGTRASDVITIPNPSWFNPNAGTFIVTANAGPNTSGMAIAIDDGVPSDSPRGFISNISASRSALVRIGAANKINVTSAVAIPVGSLRRLGLSYATSGGAFYDNGTQITTNTNDMTGFAGTRIILGARFAPGIQAFLNEHIQKLEYYNTRLPDAQIANLTTIPTYLGFVATGARMPDTLFLSSRGFNSRTHHIMRADVNNVKVMFPNWVYNSNGGRLEAASAGPATITASIEYPVDVFNQITFSGSISGVVASGGNIIGECNVTIPDGADFWVRENRLATASICVQSQNLYNASDFDNGDRFEYSTSAVADKTMGGTITNTVATFPRPQAAPIAILGMTSKPSVLIEGDSKARGANDMFDATGDVGEVARSIGRKYGYSNCGAYGNTLATFNSTGGHERQVALAQYATHVIGEYGINDIIGGASAATLQAGLQTFASFFPGKKVSHCTISPRTSSTDQWTTSVNQTSTATNSVRSTFNNYIRTTPAPLWAYHDTANVVETAQNSGIWKSDGVTPFLWTPDGIHQSQYGHIMIAASRAIDPLKFWIKL